MQGKSNLVTKIDGYSNLYVQNLTFHFHDFEFHPMTLVLKLDLDMVVNIPKMRSNALKLVIQNERKFEFFGCHDLGLDPMTLVLKPDLDIVSDLLTCQI